MRLRLVLSLVFLAAIAADHARAADAQKTYVGSEKCGECHGDEYESYKSNSKKAHSFASVKRMKKYLSEKEFQSCFACHTIGFGKPGGFRSEEETPKLKDLGCETCHGPGSLHVEKDDGKNIQKTLTAEMCMVCHTKDRSVAFRFKPAMFGGTHNK
ncbi:MAG: multiheme c-type cytochrome [Chitinivibrionales bacterium]|nr:multiheme c-type cytochrome [Chitinivibrionales bacterium]